MTFEAALSCSAIRFFNFLQGGIINFLQQICISEDVEYERFNSFEPPASSLSIVNITLLLLRCHVAYRFVHSSAILSCSVLSLTYCVAMLPTSGSAEQWRGNETISH